jgi:hypothetical protein
VPPPTRAGPPASSRPALSQRRMQRKMELRMQAEQGALVVGSNPTPATKLIQQNKILISILHFHFAARKK